MAEFNDNFTESLQQVELEMEVEEGDDDDEDDSCGEGPSNVYRDKGLGGARPKYSAPPSFKETKLDNETKGIAEGEGPSNVYRDMGLGGARPKYSAPPSFKETKLDHETQGTTEAAHVDDDEIPALMGALTVHNEEPVDKDEGLQGGTFMLPRPCKENDFRDNERPLLGAAMKDPAKESPSQHVTERTSQGKRADGEVERQAIRRFGNEEADEGMRLIEEARDYNEKHPGRTLEEEIIVDFTSRQQDTDVLDTVTRKNLTDSHYQKEVLDEDRKDRPPDPVRKWTNLRTEESWVVKSTYLADFVQDRVKHWRDLVEKQLAPKLDQLVLKDNILIFVMQFLPGSTLKGVLRRDLLKNPEVARPFYLHLVHFFLCLMEIKISKQAYDDIDQNNVMVLSESRNLFNLMDFDCDKARSMANFEQNLKDDLLDMSELVFLSSVGERNSKGKFRRAVNMACLDECRPLMRHLSPEHKEELEEILLTLFDIINCEEEKRPQLVRDLKVHVEEKLKDPCCSIESLRSKIFPELSDKDVHDHSSVIQDVAASASPSPSPDKFSIPGLKMKKSEG